MAQGDLVRRYLEAAAEFGQVTRSRAESIVKDLVRAGEVQREQTQERIDELMDWSRRSADNIREIVRREINTQLSAMGVATKADLAALERKLTRSTGAKKSAAKKTPAKKKSAKKSAAKKSAAKKSAAKKRSARG